MIVFASDNGSPKGRAGGSGSGSNEPFAGAGYSTMEGRMRVSAIVLWKNKIPAGTTCNELVTMMDWLPTFSLLCGAKIPNDRVIDGKNIWPLLTGEKNAKSPHHVFFYYMMDQLQAVRMGKWKLILPLENKFDGGNRKIIYGSCNLKLIDLSNDLKEERDLSAQHPA
jgi:arylsulfatase A-like enzyme